MPDRNDPRCFTCRQVVEDPPVLNRLEDGSLCCACRDRVLDSLPSLLPSSPSDVEIEEPEFEDSVRRPRSLILVDGDGEDFLGGYDDPPQPA